MSPDDSAALAHALGERVKELTALHRTATLLENDHLAIDHLLQGLVDLLPPAFQFPDTTRVRARYGDVVAESPGFDEGLAVLASPFTSRDAIAGSLEVTYVARHPRAAEGPFLAEERRLLDSIARMVVTALDRRLAQAAAARAEAALKEALAATETERDRVRMLFETTSDMTSTLDLPELLRTISARLQHTVPHHFASVTLWDAEAETLRRHALASTAPAGVLQDGVLLRTDRPTPARMAFDRGETMIFRTADSSDLGDHARQVMKAEGLAAACCIPLRGRRGIFGTLNIASPDPETFTAGRVVLLEQIATQFALAADNALAYREISELKDRLNEEKHYLVDEITAHHEFRAIVGKSARLSEVLHQIRTVAPTDATVLLIGETGTGKELLARAVHEASRRHSEPFVRVNGAALPANLVESELFGYERGAFTGAVDQKPGRFELAHRGTLFLDEVGEIPLEVQPRLLRVLQEQEVERLGGTRTIRVDVRMIAATNRSLEDMVDEGTFRRDLFYRLNVFPIRIPPLRERPEDIGPLARHFATRFGHELGREITSIPASTLQLLQQWSWPGNIRELQNVIERAVILSPGGELRVPAGALQPSNGTRRPSPSQIGATFEDAERETILAALRAANGVISGPEGAAARLGIKRTTLHSRMRKLGIERAHY